MAAPLGVSPCAVVAGRGPRKRDQRGEASVLEDARIPTRSSWEAELVVGEGHRPALDAPTDESAVVARAQANAIEDELAAKTPGTAARPHKLAHP